MPNHKYIKNEQLDNWENTPEHLDFRTPGRRDKSESGPIVQGKRDNWFHARDSYISQHTMNRVFFSKVTNHGVCVVTSIQTLWNINDLLHYKYASNITSACVPIPFPQLNFLVIRFISNFSQLNTVSNIEVRIFQYDQTIYRNIRGGGGGFFKENLTPKQGGNIWARTF